MYILLRYTDQWWYLKIVPEAFIQKLRLRDRINDHSFIQLWHDMRHWHNTAMPLLKTDSSK